MYLPFIKKHLIQIQNSHMYTMSVPLLEIAEGILLYYILIKTDEDWIKDYW